jgi:predicted HD phosphohydrolase
MSDQLENTATVHPPPSRRALLRETLSGLATLLTGAAVSACAEPAFRGSEQPSTSEPENGGELHPAPRPPLDGGEASPVSRATSEESARGRAASLHNDAGARLDRDLGGLDAGRATIATAALACARPTPFPAFVDKNPRASFRRTADSTLLDWALITLSLSPVLDATPDRILRLLGELDKLFIGHPRSMLSYSLLAATRAQRAGAAQELIVAALCHRVGMTVSVAAYAEISAASMRDFVSADTYQLVLHLPEFARTPLAPVPDRRAAEARYGKLAWYADAVRLADEWLSSADSASEQASPLAAFEPLVRAQFRAADSERYKTKNDCF